MSYRSLHSSLTSSLLNGEEFLYAHLVKFEKPIASLGTTPSRQPNTYRYITDASYDIAWDDGSTNTSGTSNGTQVYRAKGLKSISSITESIEAKATSLDLVLAANALGTRLYANFTTDATTMTISGDEDFVSAGFTEGDEVTFVEGTNAGKIGRLERFTNDNKTAYYTQVEGTWSVQSGLRTLKLASKELSGIILDRTSDDFARYINREIYIYKAHISPDDGSIIGAPFLLFKGIIASGRLTEDVTKETVVSWSVTSHWGDFVTVVGRLTSDDAHRAKTGKGPSDLDALVRPEYANDYGFMHAEQAINLIATYKATEIRYEQRRSGGWISGMLGQKRLVEVEVEVDREVDLKLNLQARYLPVVYGVQKVDSIPVFVDTLQSDPATVYVVYAICEGAVHSLYDVYFDDESSICLSEMDQNARQGTDTASVTCIGRSDRGDVLDGNLNITGNVNFVVEPPTGVVGKGGWTGRGQEPAIDPRYNEPSEWFDTPSTGTTRYESAVGLEHEKSTSFQSPINTWIQFYRGLPDQEACNQLVDVAEARNFLLQNSYFSDIPENYWNVTHRLLDTAYVVAKYQISEGETQLPGLDFVVKGRLIECYNYDYSYMQDVLASPVGNPANFEIGDTVTLGDGASGTATIAWITQIAQPTGANRWRVRFTADPSITSTAFSISNGTDKLFLATYDSESLTTTVPSKLEETISAAAPTTVPASSGVDLTVAGNTIAELAGLTNFQIAILTLLGAGDILERASAYRTSNTEPAANNILTGVGTTSVDANTLVNGSVVVRNAVQLGANASSSDDAYNGLKIRVTRTLSDGSQYKQEKIITSYDGGTKVASTNTNFHPDYIPDAGDVVTIFAPGEGDLRVSTNPVMQLLDYITNDRFGRKLSIEDDINLDTWLEAARKCDTRSKVRVTTTSAPDVGDVYKFEGGGSLKFQGTVAQDPTDLGGGLFEVVFEDVIGKLCYKWNNWRTFKVGDLYWWNGYLNQKTGSAGTVLTEPTSGSASVALTKVSGTGPASLTVDTSEASFDGNPVVKEWNDDLKIYINGYDLYDSDDVVYWRYVGWETPDQEYVTRHQTNMVINTGESVFDNINNFLGHFNGILRYNAGKYELDVASAKDADESIGAYTPSHITEDDIIGSINIEDSGSKKTYNHVSCTIVDPANKFEGRSATYLNSTYLKQDRNIVKKGNVKTPGITCYYNARLNAKQYLEESRYGLSINFTMPPKGILLLAGEIITLTNARLEFDAKPFRITNVTLKPNGLVQINAFEHTDTAYLIEGTQAEGAGRHSVGTPANLTAPNPVVTFNATRLMGGGIELTWDFPTIGYIPSRDRFEIWRSSTSHFSDGNAKLIATVDGSVYLDNPSGDITTVQAYYYWIRVKRLNTAYKSGGRWVYVPQTYSTYFPNIAESPEPAGILGQNYLGMTGINIHIANPVSVIPVNNSTSPPTPDLTATGTTVTVTMNGAKLDFDNTSPHAPGSFNLEVNDYSGLTIPGDITTHGSDPKIAVIGPIGDFTAFTSFALVDYTVTVVDWDSQTYIFEVSQSYSPVSGSQGLSGYNTAQILCYKRNATQPTATGVGEGPTNGLNDITYTFATGQWSSGPFNGWSTTIPGSTSPPTPCWVTAQTAISQDTTDTFQDANWTVPVQVFSDATSGADADYIIISGERLFLYEPGNSVPTNGGVLRLTAQLFGQLTNYQWQYYSTGESPTWVDFPIDSSFDYYDLHHDFSGWGGRDSLRVRCVSDGPWDEFTVAKLYATSNAFTVDLSDASVTVPMPAGGSPNTGDYTNTGLDIRVFYGITPCPYDSSSPYGTPSFRIGTINDVNITVDPTPTSVGSPPYIRRWGPADDITAATAYIDFEIICVDPYGNETTFNRRQSFSRLYEGEAGQNARYVVVSGEQVFHYTSGEATPDVSSIVLSAQLFGEGVSGYDWEYLNTTVSPPVWTNLSGTNTNQTYELFYNNTAWGGEPAVGGTNSLTVRCTDSTNAYYDTYSIIKVFDGAQITGGDAIEITLDNPTTHIPVASDGNIIPTSFSNSGCEIAVYEGVDPMNYDGVGTANGTWTVSATPSDGITLGAGGVQPGGNSPDKYAVYPPLDAMIPDTGYVTYLVSGTLSDGSTFANIPKKQTFSKTFGGEDAKTLSISASSLVFKVSDTGITPNQITLTANLTGTLTGYDWEYQQGTTWNNYTGDGAWINLEGSPQNGQTYILGPNDTAWGGSDPYNYAWYKSSLKIRCRDSSGNYSDEVTITKLFDKHGENLVRNGTGEWGNLNNWIVGQTSGNDISRLSLVNTGGPIDNGPYFRYSGEGYTSQVLLSEEPIPIDPNSVYEWSMYMKDDSPPSPAPTHINGIAMFDSDGVNINYGRSWLIPGTDAQLFEDVGTGYGSPPTNIASIKIKPIVGTTFNAVRNTAFYNPGGGGNTLTTNANVVYGDETGPITTTPLPYLPYNRVEYLGRSDQNNAYMVNSSTAGDDETVTGSHTGYWEIFADTTSPEYYIFDTGYYLRTQGVGGRANDWITLGGEGSGYLYTTNNSATTNWTKYTTYITGINTLYERPQNLIFRAGTKYIRFLMYMNYQNGSTTLDFGGCSIKKIPAIFTGVSDNSSCDLEATTNGLVNSSHYPLTGGTFRTYLDGTEVTTSGDVTYSVDSISSSPAGMVPAYITVGENTGTFVANNIPQNTTDYTVTYKAVFTRGNLTRTTYAKQTVKITNHLQGQLTLTDYSDAGGLVERYGQKQITTWYIPIGWDLCTYSEEQYTGPVRLDFKTYSGTQTNQSFMVGFSDYSDMSVNADWERVAFAFYFQQNYGGPPGNPGISAWMEGANVGQLVNESVTPHTADDVWSIIWNGRSYTMLKNGAYFSGPYKPASTPAFHRLFIAFGGNATTDGVKDINMIATGLRTATAYLYQRTIGTTPTLPSNTLTYTFSTQLVSGDINNNWEATIPTDLTDGDTLWVTTATAVSALDTDNIYQAEWSTPQTLAINGDYVDIRFSRHWAKPSAPTTPDPTDWFNAIPQGDETLWSTSCKKTYSGVQIEPWSDPVRVNAITYRGTYQQGVQYYQYDVVYYNGSSYICSVDTNYVGGVYYPPSGTGQPNDYWDLFAAEGTDGAPANPPAAFSGTYSITSSVGNGFLANPSMVNLRDIADANGYTGQGNATITYNVTGDRNGSGGNAPGGIAIHSGIWPTGYTITLTLNIAAGITVWGGGGGGGYGGALSPGLAGRPGGDAIYLDAGTGYTITINNSGTIRGGSGGGGGGGSVKWFQQAAAEWAWVGGGGGGGGAPNGWGQAGGVGWLEGTTNGSAGGTGTTSAGGGGGAGGTGLGRAGGTGGAGGTTTAVAGATGAAGSGGTNYAGGAGGAAGKAVNRNGHTEATSNGTVYGDWS